jgi:NAD(P)-dependent dehydrogenase (short-subunit alcohol dehydrogenase family)
MAEELAPEGVAVVSIWPSMVRTEHIEARHADGISPAIELPDLEAMETPRYSGRAVVALAADADRMRYTAGSPWVAELAADYGFTDEHGRSHPIPE